MFEWLNWVPRESKVSRQLREQTEARLASLSEAHRRVFAGIDVNEIARDALREAIQRRGGIQEIPAALIPFSEQLFQQSGMFDAISHAAIPKTTAERIVLENRLRDTENLLANAEAAFRLVRSRIVTILTKLLQSLGDDLLANAPRQFDVRLIDLFADRAPMTDSIIGALDSASVEAKRSGFGLFNPLLDRIDENAKASLGMARSEDWGRKRRPRIVDLKGRNEKQALAEIVDGTVFADLFDATYGLPLPLAARFEHTLFLARTGWGKTQALEWLLNADFEAAIAEPRSIIVMESEGGLIDRLSRHPIFDPNRPGNIADRLVVIDPSRDGCMPELSLFDLGTKDLFQMSELEREKAVRNSIDLYEYVFRAIRGSELTEKQSFVFVQLVHLMAYVNGATFDTLVDCLDDEAQAIRLAAKAPVRLREFFEKKYAEKQFKETRTQIYQRLETFRLTGASFVKLLSGKRSSLNFLEAIDAGKIILINTSKDHLGEEGSRILGRFMTALIRQSSLQREIERGCPCFFYMDEAQESLDEKAKTMFAQARKRRIGLVVAFQNLSDLPPAVSKGIISNTNNKICGGVEANDKEIMSRALKCESGLISGLGRQPRSWGEFALHIQDVTTGGAVKVRIPYGSLDRIGLLPKTPAPLWPQNAPPSRNQTARTTSNSPVTGSTNPKAPTPKKMPLGSIWKR